ncbi:hypothetical protein RJ639_011655 [Escallonia herrerae]|uniref:PUM-HD domain-containing protein n=1 Tax=Escallonia herrerae TaxID=1293975 RepID=A0AA88VU22_9ASTE|nr:hypothetical protein RJ639_011655 [Escallonia herrerae]
MDHGIADPYFGTGTPPFDFSIPTLGSSSWTGNNQDPTRRRVFPAVDRQSPFLYDPDQALEAAFSSLNLSPAAYHQHLQQPPCLPATLDDVGGIAGAEGLAPFYSEGSESDVSLERLRFLKGQMGSGVAHHIPLVGSRSFDPTAAALEVPWYIDDRLTSCSEFDQRYNGSYLLHKQQLPRNLDAQFGNLPHFNRVMVNSMPNNTKFSRSNLCNSRNFYQLSNFSLEKMRGWIVAWAKDQYGSKILQTKFDGLSWDEIEVVLPEVIDHVGDLMKSQFGNHLIQKLVVVCDEEQRTRIILSVTKTPFQLIGICLNQHGARTVQKLLEHVSTPHQVSLVMSALSLGAATLANDQNGHHVIQFCLVHFSSEDNKHLLDEITENCFGIATDSSGCCVLQSCVEHSRGEPRDRLVSEIMANAIYLAEDPYGFVFQLFLLFPSSTATNINMLQFVFITSSNYVLQHMLGLRIPEITADLLRQLKWSYVSLSCNKYASNVVEKCLVDSGEEHSTEIINELLKSPNASMLLVDPYGNFVIQSALSVSTVSLLSHLSALV